MFWKKKKLPFPEENMKDLASYASSSNGAVRGSDVLRELDELSRVEGADYRIAAFCQRAISAAQKFGGQKSDFLKVLASKFEIKELTYGRYHKAVDQASEVVEANLKKLPFVIRSAIKTDGLRERKLIEELIVENEMLLTATAELTAELSVLDTDQTSAKAETTLHQLEELRKRAHLYSAS